MSSGMSQRSQVHDIVASAVGPTGCDLEEVALGRVGSRTVLRVSVDADEPPSIDKVAEVSRAISQALDGHDGIIGRGPYVLEVGTPGVDRPLTEPKHWRRAIGRLVEVSLPDRDSVLGRVTGVSENHVILTIDGSDREFSFADVGAGHVHVELNRPKRLDDEEDMS